MADLATMHSVETNGATGCRDLTQVRPDAEHRGASGQIVPVLDCGGDQGEAHRPAFPTHEQACQWGVKKITVTVWEYVWMGSRRRILGRSAEPGA